ncbi:sulfite oxidase [Sanyastnella coralliicola]|uniref:sulfite oxidase n=1 Tax=Sanyastnella coralliicola TaxID=3069118 RepID=UPI0027B8825C|nr:sulfite oxidase [Longitalea sp. SCSIO 12813]
MRKRKIGIHQLYAEDPQQADELLWGRRTDESRRGFLKKAGLAAMAAAVGGKIVFADQMPSGIIPAILARPEQDFSIPGKHPDLVVLNDKPWNVETPPYLLDDEITPADRFFIRNNGLVPEDIDVGAWTLTIDGESIPEPITLSIDELKSNFEHHTYRLTLECGGNGRSEFNPPAKGNQWSTGAVACAEWTGVRLKDVLNYAKVKSDAVYVGYYGKDVHLSRNPNKVTISRGVPIAKAMEDESLIAWAMNGEDIPVMNGHPLRMVIGGWPASVSGKWLSRLSVRNKVHDGLKMEAPSYRVPCEKVAPGQEVKAEDMCIIESMPVKSLITYPKTGAVLKGKKSLTLRGHAWAGDLSVNEMHISIDFGSTWQKASLNPAANRLAWQRWEASVNFPEKGYYEVWAKATDSEGKSQPMVVPGWNPKGYLNNATHRIAVKVE